MPITIGSNIQSLAAQRRLAEGSDALGKVFERLSSGMRINRASDDAAGLAISDSLRTDSLVFNQGIRNFNDGISLLNIADSALEQLSLIVVRLTELAEQSANGTYSNFQRNALDTEAQALAKEYFRVSRVTEFNNLSLFNGSVSQLRLQGGYGLEGGIATGLGGALGTGTFSTATNYNNGTASQASHSVASGDINGDGLIDIVTAGVTDGNAGYAAVFLGLGNGSFSTGISYAAEGAQSDAVELGDINGDGILDLVTAGYAGATDGYATVRLGIGNGTFGGATSYITETMRSYDLALGDLNNDGILDLVTAGRSDTNDGYATIRLGRGDGTFGTATSYTTETLYSRGVTLGDLNNDGVLDLVTTGLTDGNVGYMTVRLGRGDGTFGTATSYTQETRYSDSAAIADLNGDGINDLITSGQSAAFEGYLTVRLGAGDGTFGAATSYLQGGLYARNLIVGDVNGDGLTDAITVGRTAAYDGFLTVRLGAGDGTFAAATSYLQDTQSSQDVTLADFNGDGVADPVTTGESDSSDSSFTIRLSDVIDGVHPILPFSLKTMADARQALPIFQRKRDQLAAHRGTIGAYQSRLTVAIGVLQASSENSRAAESRIRDSDIAEESSNLIRLNILQKAASSVLSQANQQPALALRLLSI